MLIYWLLFAYFAVGALIEADRAPDFHKRRPFWILGGILIFVMVGFRFEVGADWFNYEFIFKYAGQRDLAGALSIGDPGYQLVNWLVHAAGGELVWVNVVCALLFSWGLFRLARLQPDPWLAILVAIPYMVIVASNYTRQAAALGLIMAGLAALGRGGSLVRFIVYVALAATFHRTAIAVLPLVIFSRPRNRLLSVVGGLAAFAFLFDIFLADAVDELVANYIDTKYSSQGAAIRIAMSVLAAIVFLALRKRMAFPERDDRLWFYFSIASFAALVALILTPSSTAIDRISIYLMPLQMVILSRIPFTYVQRRFGTLLVGAYCLAVQFVWLNFAAHAQYWIPYQFYPLFD